MKKKSQVLIIDFYDSFTFNIASELYLNKISSRVVPFDKPFEKLKSETVVIWGPGPGHPSEYMSVYPKLKVLFEDKTIFHMGICLGHQLFFYFSNYKIIKSKKPMHGQSILLSVPKWKNVFPVKYHSKGLRVQRYNSLAVKEKKSSISPKVINRQFYKRIVCNNEVILAFGENWISYQFHPESVGTEGRKCFFEPLINFLYNE